MTHSQETCLAWFRAQNIGAVLVEGEWRWAQDIRDNPAIAQRLLAMLATTRSAELHKAGLLVY